jgi:hypothetical protein
MLANLWIPPLADRLWREQAVPARKPVHFEQSVQSLTFEKERLTPSSDIAVELFARPPFFDEE